jgi:hypothetical protein
VRQVSAVARVAGAPGTGELGSRADGQLRGFWTARFGAQTTAITVVSILLSCSIAQ